MLKIKLLSVRKIREHVPGARARAERRKSGAFKYYVTRDGGSGVFKQGGASVQIYAPPLHPRDDGFTGVVYLLIYTYIHIYIYK